MTTATQVHDPADEGHLHGATLTLVDNRCPTCDQPLAAEQLEFVRTRVAEQEQQRDAEKAALIEATRAAAEADALARVTAAEQKAAERLAEIEAAHATEVLVAREEATTAANVASATVLADLEGKCQAAENELEVVRAAQDTLIEARLTEQREILEEERVKAVNVANAEAFEEKQRLVEKVADLDRQLQHKTSNEWGEGTEIDLYEALKAEFPDDKIVRVKKGSAGADIIHTVIENGEICGGIVYDSKNRKAWRNEFVEKLRNDQIAAKADHAILTTYKFPAGVRQLHIQDGVLITNPARAVVLATILRRQVVQLHALRLTNDEREEKMVSLYDYITSDRFSQRFDQMASFTDSLLEIDVKEKEAHDRTWKKRGTVVRSIQRAQGDIESEINRIVIDGSSDSDDAV